MATPRKALIAVISAHAPFFYSTRKDFENKKTGLWIAQNLQAFQIFRKAGFEVDLVSKMGEYDSDWLSLHDEWLEGEEREIYEDRDSEFRYKLDHLMAPDKVTGDEYGLFFAAGGHAALIDFPDARRLQGIASRIYMNGGIVSAVCHGGAILPGVIDPKTGKSIISGKMVTGFATKAEKMEQFLMKIESWNRHTIEHAVADAGATFVSPLENPFEPFTHTDGRIVTGANPLSAISTAEEAVKAFDKL